MIRILAVLLLAVPAFGTSVQLGTQSFNDGDIVASPAFASAVDVTPFNVNTGSDVFSPPGNASFSFTFTFAPVSGVTSASILLSLYDLDSAASGNQIGSFTVGGVDLTTTLNNLAETAAVGQSQIAFFTVTLPSTVFPTIQAGSVPVTLLYSGHGIGGGDVETTTNGGGIDFAKLTYDTGVVTPEPSSFLLLGSGGLAILLRKRRSRELV